jgi:hypothetical protein
MSLSRHVKMEGLLIDSQVTVQIGNRQLILEEYTNDDGIRINEKVSIKFVLNNNILH